MSLKVLNPNHPATQIDRDTLYKCMLIVARKYAGGHAVVSLKDLEGLSELALATHFHKDSIEFEVMGMAEAERRARDAGGMPS